MRQCKPRSPRRCCPVGRAFVPEVDKPVRIVISNLMSIDPLDLP